MMCKYCNIWSVNDEISVFRLKITMHEVIELHAFNFLDPSSWLRNMYMVDVFLFLQILGCRW
jgi:hypothetical protein